MRVKIGDTEYPVPDDYTNKDVMAVEKATDMTFDQWQMALQAGSMTAVTGLVFMLRRSSEPGLTFDDIDFGLSTFDIILDDDEKRDAIRTLDGDKLEKFREMLEPGEEERLLKEPDPTEAG